VTFDISTVAGGLYIVEIADAMRIQRRKVLIQH
jgi:hypothetical protein